MEQPVGRFPPGTSPLQDVFDELGQAGVATIAAAQSHDKAVHPRPNASAELVARQSVLQEYQLQFGMIWDDRAERSAEFRNGLVTVLHRGTGTSPVDHLTCR